MTLVWPDFFGSPLTRNYRGPLNYNEINGAYIGVLPLLLAAGSLFVKNKTAPHKFFLCLSIFAMAMVLQLPLLYTLVKFAPGFNASNSNRMLLLVGFANTVLAVYAVDTLLAKLRRSALRTGAIGLLFVLVFVDLFHFGRHYNPVVDQRLAYPATATTDFLNHDPEIFRIATPLQVFPHETHLPYQVPSIRGYDALEIRTYTEFMSLLSDDVYAKYFVFPTSDYNRVDSPLFDLLNVKYFIRPPGEEMQSPVRLVFATPESNVYLNAGYLPRAFLVSNYVVVPDAAARLARLADPAFDPARTLLLEQNVTFPVNDIAGSTAAITQYTPNQVEITVRTPAETFLVLTDNYFPGWEAAVNGRATTILRADHTFRAVRVPAGASKIIFRYRPRVIFVGAILSTVTALVLLYLLLAGTMERASLLRKKGAT